ncbi:hypothetical protein GGR00_004090 [Aminobacter aganoensis]|uniref:Uncharacterized protein n=1 Tax=Aminobacter aganoensis TaxID=83264 RepID=A0A7X0FAQ5_9HYPH|nr:hypothetical protein [Aminobacter aganoensis]
MRERPKGIGADFTEFLIVIVIVAFGIALVATVLA